MRSILTLLLVFAALPALAFTAPEPYRADFANAQECQTIDGRKVWRGERAYYIQAWLFQTGQSGLLDEEAVSVVSIADNETASLDPFAKACD